MYGEYEFYVVKISMAKYRFERCLISSTEFLKKLSTNIS